MANCDSNKNINKTFIIEPLELTAGTPTISACTSVYTSKVLACSGDTFIELYSGVTINGNTLVNNTLSANTIDASIILSGGTNILDIVNANDTFVTGGTFNNVGDSLSLLRNDGDSIIITGITDFFTTGGTYNNNNSLITFDRNDQLSAFTVDLSTIDVNDTFVSGFTRIGNVLTIERNDGVDLPLDISDIVFSGGSGNCITDLYVTNINGCSPINVKDDLILETKLTLSGTPLLDNTLPQLLVRDSATGEIKYRDADSVDTFVTGATLVNKELVLDRNDSLSAVTVDLSGLTSNAGAGLTYNETTGKIDLGGVLNHNDPSNAANNVYFTPAATGANGIAWGLDSSYNPSGNYIGRFDTFTFQGKQEIHGAFQHSGVHIGLYISNTPSNSFRQYKDVTKILGSGSFPGPTSGMTYQEFDTPTQHQREIWESEGSNTRSKVKQTFDEFEWNVYNNVGGDNATSKTFFHIESERIVAGAVNSGGTKFGIFQFSPLNIQFLDGDFKGIFTAPSTTYVGDVTKSYLSIVNNLNVSDDSFFNDGTSNKRGIKYKGFGETNTETGVGANYSTLVGTSLVPKKYVDDYIASPSGNTFVTGTTFTNNQLNIALNNGTSVGTTIDNLSGLTVDGNLLINGDVNIIGSATTINSEQVLIKDNIITLNSNVTGSTTPILNSGFEVLRGSGDTKSILWLENTDLWSIDDDLSVSGYVSGTTYYGDGSNLTGIDDTFVTGGTYSGSTIILNRNDGNSVDVTGITSDSIYTSNGVLSSNRAVNLDSKSLTITGGTTNNATPLNFEFGGFWQGFTRWDNEGAVKIKSNNNNAPLRVYKKVDAVNPSFQVNSAGGGLLTELWSFTDVGGGTTTKVDINNVSIKHYFGNTEYHRIKLGGAGSGVYFWKTGFSSLGDFIVGGSAVVGTEDISLQGDTLISKKLELSTTTDGFLMPRLTTAQKNAISSPDTNLMVFDTDLNSLQRYNGSAWVDVAGGSDTFVTGGTYSGSTIVLNRNDGNSVDITGITTSSIYTQDGTLSGNRVVDQGSYTLTFNGNNVGAITSNFNGRTAFISNRTSGEANILEVQDNSNNRIFEVRQNNSVHINAQGTGDVVLGGDSLIGNETISLQGSTLVNNKFEIQTTTGGFLMPRLTTAQMNAISSPDTHLLIFNTDLNCVMRYNGSAWTTFDTPKYVLKNGNTHTPYSSLYTAINNATSGSTIDVNVSETVDCGGINTWTWGSDITINFNGHHTIFSNLGRILLAAGVSLGINNGTLESSASVSSNTAAIMFSGGNTIKGDGAITVFQNTGVSQRGSFQSQTGTAPNYISGVIMKGSYTFCVKNDTSKGRIYIDNCILYTDLSTNVDALLGDNMEVSNSTIHGRAFTFSGTYSIPSRETVRVFNNCTIISDGESAVGSRSAIFNSCTITTNDDEVRIGIGGEQEYYNCKLERTGTVGLAFVITNTSNVRMYHTQIISTGTGVSTNLPMEFYNCYIKANGGSGIIHTTSVTDANLIVENTYIEATGGNCMYFNRINEGLTATVTNSTLICNTANSFCLNSSTGSHYKILNNTFKNTADSNDIYSRVGIYSENPQIETTDAFGNIILK